MEKFDAFKPDEETIEAWLDAFEARLQCFNIVVCAKKRSWCQSLVGEAGRAIIKELPPNLSWDQIKQELLEVLGEANPKESALNKLLSYKAGEKGLGEIASDVMAKARRATDDQDVQNQLGLKAFLSAVPVSIGKDLRRKHLLTVKEALDEARFLQRVEEDEKKAAPKVLTLTPDPDVKTKPPSQENMIEECLKQLAARGLLGDSMQQQQRKQRNRGRRAVKCWCCGEEGHVLMQCPIVNRNRTAAQSEVSSSESPSGNV